MNKQLEFDFKENLYIYNFMITSKEPETFINLYDILKIDKEGVEYKGERIEDAGRVYNLLIKTLEDG